MKQAFFLLILFFYSYQSNAECASMGMDFLPKTKEISLNSMFIIQGYGFSQKTISGFKNRTIYLENTSGELIELNLIEIIKGQMYLTQAIFKPCESLQPDTKYHLRYSDQTPDETREMMRWNPDKKKKEKLYWKTSHRKKADLLNVNLNIEYKNTELFYFGCGPSVNLIFDIKNISKSETWYKTEMMDVTSKVKTVFYLTSWNKQLRVGHGMCSGAFMFKRKGRYKIRFTPVNTDGLSLKTTEWKTFNSPFMNENGNFR